MVNRTLLFVLVAGAVALVGCRKKLDVTVPEADAGAAAPVATVTAAADTASAAATAATDSVEPLASLAPTKPPPPVVGAAAAKVVKPAASAAAAAAAAGGEPKECALARKMKEKGLMREFDTLSKLCTQKGGKI